MNKTHFISLFLLFGSVSHAGDQSFYKKDVTLWYTAFDKHDPALLARVLSETWHESPSALGTRPAGKSEDWMTGLHQLGIL